MGEEAMEEVTISAIARLYGAFPQKFGIPRQSNIVDNIVSRIVFEPEYRNVDALRGIDDFDYLWLVWRFSANERQGWSPTVRRAWVVISVWESLLHAHRSGLMAWLCRQSDLSELNDIPKTDRYFM